MNHGPTLTDMAVASDAASLTLWLLTNLQAIHTPADWNRERRNVPLIGRTLLHDSVGHIERLLVDSQRTSHSTHRLSFVYLWGFVEFRLQTHGVDSHYADVADKINCVTTDTYNTLIELEQQLILLLWRDSLADAIYTSITAKYATLTAAAPTTMAVMEQSLPRFLKRYGTTRASADLTIVTLLNLCELCGAMDFNDKASIFDEYGDQQVVKYASGLSDVYRDSISRKIRDTVPARYWIDMSPVSYAVTAFHFLKGMQLEGLQCAFVLHSAFRRSTVMDDKSTRLIFWHDAHRQVSHTGFQYRCANNSRVWRYAVPTDTGSIVQLILLLFIAIVNDVLPNDTSRRDLRMVLKGLQNASAVPVDHRLFPLFAVGLESQSL